MTGFRLPGEAVSSTVPMATERDCINATLLIYERGRHFPALPSYALPVGVTGRHVDLWSAGMCWGTTGDVCWRFMFRTGPCSRLEETYRELHITWAFDGVPTNVPPWIPPIATDSVTDAELLTGKPTWATVEPTTCPE
jgi:hypothetical protein